MQTVLQSLQATFTEQDAATRNQAEQELEKLSQEKDSYLYTLLQIVTTQTPEITQQIRHAAATNLRKFARKLSDSNQLEGQTREFFAKSIFNALVQPGLEGPVRATLGYALVPIVSLDTGDPMGSTVASLMPDIVSGMGGEPYSIIGCCKMIKAVFSGFSENSMTWTIFKQLLDPMVNSGLSTNNTLKTSISEGKTNEVNLCLEVLYELCAAFTSILEYFEISSRTTMKETKDLHQLAYMYHEVLNLAIPDPRFASPCLIGIAPDQPTTKLNQVKSQILQGVNLILQCLQETKKDHLKDSGVDTVISLTGVDMPDSPFINTLQSLVEPFTLSLSQILSVQELDEILQSENVTELVIEVLLVLHKLVRENRFLSFFSQNAKGFLLQICFPLLKTTQNDIEMLEDTPEEFVAEATDICERQESETYKTSAAQLFEAISDHIDGVLSFSVNLLCELLDQSLSQSPVENYPNLSQFPNSIILSLPEEIKADLAFTALSTINYSVSRRRDLTTIVENVLKKYLPHWPNVKSAVIQAKFCLFLNYYCEYVFENDSESFSMLLQSLLYFCDPNTCSKAANIQASDTISNIIQDEDVSFRLENYMADIWQRLMQIIPYQNCKGFYEGLQEIVAGHMEVVFPYIGQLVPVLVKKIQDEFSRTQPKPGKNRKTSTIIIKCWNIIRGLEENKDLTPELALQLEQYLLPLFEFMRNPSEIDFDDDIVLFETALMKKTETVTQTGWTLFQQLPLVQEKYDNTFIQLFPILNTYLYYGKEIFNSNPSWLVQVVSMCNKCIFAQYKGKTNEAANAEGALILQQILQTYIGMVDDSLESILSSAIQRFAQGINNNFFKVRLLGVVLSAVSYNAYATMNILGNATTQSNKSYLELILEQIFSLTFAFTHPYDRKVGSLGLCSIITQHSLPQIISQQLGYIFQALVDILSLKKEQPMQVDTKDNEEGTLNLMVKGQAIKNSEELEANLALSTFQSPLQQIDEYDYFRSIIANLKQTSPDSLKLLVGQLNQIQVQQLTEIIQSKRIKLASAQQDEFEVRRIVKPKSKRANQ